MLQLQQHFFGAVFFTNDVMCRGHYDVIYHPFPINSQYLKTWGVDSPGQPIATFHPPLHLLLSFSSAVHTYFCL